MYKIKRFLNAIKYAIGIAAVIFMIYIIVLISYDMYRKYKSVDIINDTGWYNSEYGISIISDFPNEWTGACSMVGKIGELDVYFEYYPGYEFNCCERDDISKKLFRSGCIRSGDELVLYNLTPASDYTGDPLPEKITLKAGKTDID